MYTVKLWFFYIKTRFSKKNLSPVILVCCLVHLEDALRWIDAQRSAMVSCVWLWAVLQRLRLFLFSSTITGTSQSVSVRHGGESYALQSQRCKVKSGYKEPWGVSMGSNQSAWGFTSRWGLECVCALCVRACTPYWLVDHVWGIKNGTYLPLNFTASCSSFSRWHQ